MNVVSTELNSYLLGHRQTALNLDKFTRPPPTSINTASSHLNEHARVKLSSLVKTGSNFAWTRLLIYLHNKYLELSK